MAALHHVGAAAPGPVTPATSDEAPADGTARGFKTQSTTDSGDSTSVGAARKQLANAQARAALKGAVLVQIEGDDGRPVYILSLGDWLREFTQLLAVENVLQRMESRS